MKLGRSTFTAALTAIGVISVAATAYADPDRPAPIVSYRAALVERSVVTTLDHGTFARTDAGDSIAIRNTAAEIVDTLPLTYSLDGQALPLRRQISGDGRTLTITTPIRTGCRPKTEPAFPMPTSAYPLDRRTA
ncbi:MULTISPECIES: hypothetical protein [Actinomycetes]|uniref:hypothetical protein n=1 Tax=Actinomycetes TaxID=1760 RepID=UPI00068C868C|nr:MULTISPECIES: hypothetical protein [Actinomycetes]